MSLFDPFPELRTPRLRLRAPCPRDAEDMFRQDTDPRVNMYFGRKPMDSIQGMRDKIEKLLENLEDESGITWVLEDAKSGAFLGSVCLWNWDKSSRRAEIGYGLDPAAWGKGLVPEAMFRVVRYGFERMGLHSVCAYVDPRNKASIRVVEKMGFLKEAHFLQDHYSDVTDTYSDTAVYCALEGSPHFEKAFQEERERGARRFAEERHGAQKYGEKPYVTHLEAVRGVLRDFGHEGDLAVAAWLHDVVEDTATPGEEVAAIFGEEVARLVWAVTGTGANRKERNLSAYAKINAHPPAATLKLADRIANVEASRGSDRMAMYQKEWPSFRDALTGLGDLRMWQRLTAVIEGE